MPLLFDIVSLLNILDECPSNYICYKEQGYEKGRCCKTKEIPKCTQYGYLPVFLEDTQQVRAFCYYKLLLDFLGTNLQRFDRRLPQEFSLHDFFASKSGHLLPGVQIDCGQKSQERVGSRWIRWSKETCEIWNDWFIFFRTKNAHPNQPVLEHSVLM